MKTMKMISRVVITRDHHHIRQDHFGSMSRWGSKRG